MVDGMRYLSTAIETMAEPKDSRLSILLFGWT